MCFADIAVAAVCCIMADTDHNSTRSVRARENSVKEISLAVFQVTPERVGTEVSNLNHSCETAIDKKRCLNNVIQLGVRGSNPMKFAHQRSVFRSD